MQMTIPQCRAARALLGWTAAELADRAEVGAATVRRFESGQTVQPEMVVKMTTALAADGVELHAGGAVFQSERGETRKAPTPTAREQASSADIGAQARTAIDDGIAALWESRKRAGTVGRLELKDFRGHWACQPSRSFEEALAAIRDDAPEAERESIDRAIEVMAAALLRHI